MDLVLKKSEEKTALCIRYLYKSHLNRSHFFVTYQFYFLVPRVNVRALGKGEAQQVLVDLQQSLGDFFEGEVFLDEFLVHSIPCFFDLVEVVTNVPKVQLAVKLVAVLTTLKLWNSFMHFSNKGSGPREEFDT